MLVFKNKTYQIFIDNFLCTPPGQKIWVTRTNLNDYDVDIIYLN